MWRSFCGGPRAFSWLRQCQPDALFVSLIPSYYSSPLLLCRFRSRFARFLKLAVDSVQFPRFPPLLPGCFVAADRTAVAAPVYLPINPGLAKVPCRTLLQLSLFDRLHHHPDLLAIWNGITAGMNPGPLPIARMIVLRRTGRASLVR